MGRDLGLECTLLELVDRKILREIVERNCRENKLVWLSRQVGMRLSDLDLEVVVDKLRTTQLGMDRLELAMADTEAEDSSPVNSEAEDNSPVSSDGIVGSLERMDALETVEGRYRFS